MSQYRRIFLALVLLLSLRPAMAQFTGIVQGTIADSDGAVVPNAAVTLTNTGTGVSYKSTSSSAGQYRFPSLPPGNFVVKVESSGFQTTEVSFTVRTEETAGVNVTLRAASSGQTVTVSSEASELNPEETRLELTLNASQLEELPAQNHGTLNFLKLAPGSTGINEGSTNIQSNRNLADSSSNGVSNASNLFTLDGVPINSVLNYATAYSGNTNGAVIFTPSVESLAEVSLQTTTFNVDYGNTASAQVGFATKSGQNKFHGTADYTYNDKIMNAVGYQQAAPVAAHSNYDSFSLGGPIFKQKTFFFGSYEHVGTDATPSSSAVWYTPEFTNFIATADANSVNVQNYILPNPATKLKPTGTSTSAATVFGANCATPAAFNVPCDMPVTYRGLITAPSVEDGKNWNIRLDQYLNNSKDRLFFFYFSTDQASNSADPHPTWEGTTPTDGKDVTANWTHQFSPNLLNSATFGYTRFNFAFSNLPSSIELLKVPTLNLIFDAGGFDSFTKFVPIANSEAQYYGRDTVLWTKGRHNLTFGVEGAYNWGTDTNFVYARPFINFYFSTLDFLNDKLDAEQVLSHYNGLTGDYEPFHANASIVRFGVYAEDSWKINPRLTVNYGLRWDDLGNPSPYSGSLPWANAVFKGGPLNQIPNTVVAKPVSGAYSSARNKNFLPRAGFAWTPSKADPNTVIRGGVGLYQDILNIQNIADTLTTNPPTGALGVTFGFGVKTLPQPILSYGNGSTVPPYGFVFPEYKAVNGYNANGSLNGASTQLSGNDPDLAVPRTILWNLAFEHQFPAKTVFSLTYSGSHGYNLNYTPDLNRPAGNVYCDKPGPGCALTNHLINPQWDFVKPTLAGLESNYAGLIAQVRQTWRTLNWQASYTWGHALSDPSNSGSAPLPSGGSIENQYDPKVQYSNADFDVRNRFTTSFVYGIPVPKGTSDLLKQFIGGWNLNGDVILQTGTPFTVYYSGASPGIYDFSYTGLDKTTYSIPNYVGGKRHGWSQPQETKGIFGDPTNLSLVDPLSPGNNLNPLFPRPAGLNAGTSGRNQFWNNGYATWDQSIVKKFDLPWFRDGRSTLSIRGQAFNLLNRVNYLPLQGGGSNNTQINSGSSFGVSPGSYQARVIQVGARFQF